MLNKFQDIELQFKHTRFAAIILMTGCVLISAWAVYIGHLHASEAQQKIYVLAAGRVLEAVATDRKDNIEVEARDHIERFHSLLFTLEPDEKLNTANITKALYLADKSAKTLTDDLREAGFYNNLIAGNISQRIETDSILLDTRRTPYSFRYYATEKLIRSTSLTTRILITRGILRNIMRSDNNPHGFLIEQLQVLQNGDIETKTR